MAWQSCSSPGPIAIDSITHDKMFDGSRRYSPMTHPPSPPSPPPPTPETVFFDLDDAVDALHLDEPARRVSPSLPTLCQDCDSPPGSTVSDAWLDRVESWIEQTEQSRPAQIVGNQEMAALTPPSQPHEAGPSSRPVLAQYLTPAQIIGSHQTCNLAPMRVGCHQHQATHSCAPTLCNIHALSDADRPSKSRPQCRPPTATTCPRMGIDSGDASELGSFPSGVAVFVEQRPAANRLRRRRYLWRKPNGCRFLIAQGDEGLTN